MNVYAKGAENAQPIATSRYASLPAHFYADTPLSPVSEPRLLKLNEALAEELGLDVAFLRSDAGVSMLAGNSAAQGVAPIALAYAGHQFGNFVPQLGDGRAVLIGEVTDRNGRLRELQLKGSGPTAFSRNGDGRAAVGPVLREYLVSEAMAALGIATTRTLAAVASGDWVYRETRLPGAVLTRVASSHIRIGTFQFFAARRDVDALRLLADHAIARHYPEAAASERPYLAFLEAVIAAQARLVARWMLVGFIHGVMNTDNMAISGETIDYGPCAFMDAHHAGTVFSSIDRAGRYSYANQPRIAVWNLTRFAETLLPLIDEDEDRAIAAAEGALKTFQGHYDGVFHSGLRQKIGLSLPKDEDLELIGNLFEIMESGEADFTLTFRGLSDELDGNGATRSLFKDPAAFDGWLAAWRARLALEPEHGTGRADRMRAVNPKYIPRNHRVEAALAAAVERQDMAPFEALLAVVSHPFDEQPGNEDYALPPRAEEKVLQTFCGT